MDPHKSKRATGATALAALGVVYGDIGTSPLYVMKTVFEPSNGLPLHQANVIGVTSLILWSLMSVVSLKYVTLILRADNQGEGGIMALLALASRSVASRARLQKALFLVGAFGAALFYGDGVITPAISVLSAVEGLEVATPVLKPYVVPVTLGVLTALFLLQKRGTGGIGTLFGPVTLVWFTTLALTGAFNISAAPEILTALNPAQAVSFCLNNGWLAFVALGAVVLAVTGGEALYADMGHFGSKPIRLAWYLCVFPALAVNYLGQGALLLSNARAVSNPFYFLFPDWALYPAVALATAATVIASQAVISGVFSITKQAIQLGFLPRMNIRHTSDLEIGQIYIPFLNWMLFLAVIVAVLGFGTSGRLGAAYGVAVTATMMIETVLTFFVLRYAWRYPWWLCMSATGFFFAIDATFFSATILKIAQGGWFPLAIGLVIFILMVTWKDGRAILRKYQQKDAVPLKPFLESLMASPPHRVAGTAIFMTADTEGTPNALVHNLAHNRILHERMVFLTVVNRDVPRIPPEERLVIEPLDWGCYRISMQFGFKDDIDVPAALEMASDHGLVFEPLLTSYFLSRETVVPTHGEGMALWRERLFATMLRNAGGIIEYFQIPVGRVIELGSRIAI